ncbi:hypothetical protein [Streptomyces xantholiticus]|uniref:hypothetical protein n=1 Tax=Streptomyces xantholiticus TaxID=68285 RepID=UPI001E42805F|nr:hypothetical protein [Streptomyces xantholiticus]
MEPAGADVYFGKVLRDAKPSTRTGRAGALAVYFQFLELRHKVELHNLTGRVVECPLDEMNRPRASVEPQLRIPPSEAEIEELFAGWREELVTCRKFGPAARNYAVARPAADVGLRINEARMLDLDDVRWELGRFGKLNVRHGKGTSGTSAATVDSSAQHHSIAQHDPAISKHWHAKVKCDIVRNGHTYTKRTAWANGPTEQAAVNTAKRNIPVEKGSYKRHCRTLESYRR